MECEADYEYPLWLLKIKSFQKTFNKNKTFNYVKNAYKINKNKTKLEKTLKILLTKQIKYDNFKKKD